MPARVGDIGQVSRGLRVEFEQARAVFPACDVELLASYISAELQVVPPVDPGKVFVELRRLVHKAGEFRAARYVRSARPADAGKSQVRHVVETESTRLILL